MRDGPVFREGAYNKIYTSEILVSPMEFHHHTLLVFKVLLYTLQKLIFYDQIYFL